MEVREAFEHAGGERFQYIPCLNDSPAWIDGMATLAEQHLQGWPTQTTSSAAELAVSRERALALGAPD